MQYVNSPLVIGATGGCGTAPVTRLCQRVGYYMGARLNKFGDTLDLLPFYDKWADVSLSISHAGLSDVQNKRMFDDFTACINKVRSGMPDQQGPWGWKNARSMYLVPFFHILYPQMRFIHIVCDGRDIAFLRDPDQLLQHTRAFFEKQLDSLLRPFRLMLLWKATNMTIASYAESSMGANYLRIRYEDLQENPYGIIKMLLRFLNIPQAPINALAAEISQTSWSGRWHAFPIDLVQQLEDMGHDALVKFGYK